jgi:WD40 repeat protein
LQNEKDCFIFPLLALLLILNTSNYAQSGLNLLWEKAVDVRTMQFTPDGNLLVTGGKSNMCNPYNCGQIKAWNVADSSLLFTFEGWQFGLTNDIDISSDGERFISGNGSVYCSAFSGCVIDRPGQYEFNINGSQLYSNTNPGGNIYSIAYSPNDSIIAAGTGYNSTGVIRIYDSNYNLLRVLLGHSSSTTDVVFTPDGQYLLSSGYDGYIRKWNYLNGSISNYWQHGTLVNGGN